MSATAATSEATVHGARFWPPRGPWWALALGCAWVVVARVPLVLNAEAHLDSDLAVDGLTLLDASEGRWRWHYPGTPNIGIPPVLLSLPFTWLWGVNAATLVLGGVVGYLLAVAAVFALAWRVFGAGAAAWTMLPLAFASTGVVWLSGRITGGHLLAVAWAALLFVLLEWFGRRGGHLHAAALGLACGLGVYLDGLLWPSVGIVLASGVIMAISRTLRDLHAPKHGARRGFFLLRASVRLTGLLAAGSLAFAAGREPQAIGKRVDPHDSYKNQYDIIIERPLLEATPNWGQAGHVALEHARLLFLDCLPRLVAGHRLPGLQSEPSPASLGGRKGIPEAPDYHAIAVASTVSSLWLGLAGAWRILRPGAAIQRTAEAQYASDSAVFARHLVVSGLVGVSALHLAAFIVMKHIYNSDNYRYLAILIVPVSLGVGAALDRWASVTGWCRRAALAFAVAYAAVMTLDLARWYRGFGWINAWGVPVARPMVDPALDWLRAHPEVDRIHGGYWDVYRLSFLTHGRVRGLPYPMYPDRFNWSRELPGYRPRLLLARGDDDYGPFYRERALREGGRVIHQEPAFWVIDWP